VVLEWEGAGSGRAMIRQGHFIAVVRAFLVGCAVFVVAGCAGVRSEASKQEEQGHTEATTEQTRSDRCEGTRTYKETGLPGPGHVRSWLVTTNDVPGCPNGGLLSGTDGRDHLAGKKGDDEIHGLDDKDDLSGGMGSDVIYGGPGDDDWLYGERGDDVIYGGDGNDGWLLGDAVEDVLYGGKGNDGLDATTGDSEDGQRDELYCGPGKDQYAADRLDYVDSSCEKNVKMFVVGGIA
jgi:uncharacterized protein YceK